MNTLSVFRFVVVEFLSQNRRCNGQWALSKFGLESVPTQHRFHRHFHLSHRRDGWVKNDQPKIISQETPGQKKLKEKKLKEIGLRGRAIPYKDVLVRTPQGLSDFRPLMDVIAEAESLNSPDTGQVTGKRNLKQYHVQLVAIEPDPIVAIIDSKEIFQRQKQAQERAKNNAHLQVRKEVQLTWASSEADIETKLEKIEEDMKKGFKVDLVIMPKKNVHPPDRKDMEQRAEDLVRHFSEVAKEWKVRDYTRTTVVIYFQGVPSAEAMVGEGSKKPKKQLVKEQRKQKEEERARKKQDFEVHSKFTDDSNLSSQ